MSSPDGPFTIALIVVTALVSIAGFRNSAFCDRYLFSTSEIFRSKQWWRMLTSAFLHADWAHLLLNMVTLFLFGQILERYLGAAGMLAVYFAAVIGGSLLSLWVHRQHEYLAYGASGGVCGVIFAFILLFPGASLSLFMLPIWIPGWLYAVLYLAGSICGMKAQAGNIGHDAHVGGALVGLWTAAALRPEAARENPLLFAAITGIGMLLFLYLTKNPLMLPLFEVRPARAKPAPDEPLPPRRESAVVDAILDKISRDGIHSLTPEEQEILKGASAKYQRRADSKKPESDLII